LIEQGMLTRGDKNNRVYVGEMVSFGPGVSGTMQSALFDPQTAGGLLISIERAGAESFMKSVPDAKIIGSVSAKGEYLINVN
jgi:selenide, water dikinase